MISFQADIDWFFGRTTSKRKKDGGERMEAYEIHVIKSASKGRTCHDALLSSDYAAIRRAKALAEDADAVEVWRAGCCIFACGSSEIDVSKSDMEAPQSQARQKLR